ncbi:hypothetical protein, partial [Escherichia coli]|uniref:hypothetical protein n=1 Tax=Escherichia coli TaxID=562 RepID=UPI0025A0AF09
MGDLPRLSSPAVSPMSPPERGPDFAAPVALHLFPEPVTVPILTPGLDEQGNMREERIPAALVAKFLDERGIVVEK